MLPFNANAIEVKENSRYSSQISTPKITLGNGYIVEEITVTSPNSIVTVVRTSYEDNSSVLEIVENGNSKVISQTIDFTQLYQILSAEKSLKNSSTRGRISGYTYTYMKSEQFTEYFTPEHAQYADILACVSIALGKYNFPLSVVAAIASIIFSHSSAPNETKLVTNRTWYIATETASGEFVCYYVEYSTKTYVKDSSGNWLYIGTESGDYETLWT